MQDPRKPLPGDAAEGGRETGAPDADRDRLALQHELRVHQEEVAVQYEQLLETRAALEESRDRYADLYDFAPIGYLTLNGHGVIQEINLTAAGMLGRQRHAILGMPLLRFVSDDQHSAFLSYLQRCRAGAGNRGQHTIELTIRTGGNPCEVQLLASPRQLPDGTAVELLTAMIDVTERRQVERQHADVIRARAGIEARDAFLATLSHELRTPLNPVLTALTDPHTGDGLPPAHRELLDMMRRNLKLEARLIDDLLDLTRISTGRLAVARAPANVHVAIADVIAMFETQARERGVRFDPHLEAPQSWVTGDATRIQQVVWNLVSNALKFTPSGGTITISTCNAGSGAINIRVRDTGRGIEPARLAEIFATSDNESVPRPVPSDAGLGIGLAICRHLVAEHGGTLTASSDGANAGSVFTVTLPAGGPPAAAAAAAASDAIGRATAKNVRILVVEDDADSATMLAAVLELNGYEVTVARSVAEAANTIDKAARLYDLLISDLRLPDGSGLDLMRELRRAKSDLPAIALTGFARAEDERRSREAGFAVHLAKPVDTPILVATIERLTKRT